MPTREILATPSGEMMDLIACHQILNGAKEKIRVKDEDDPFPDLK